MYMLRHMEMFICMHMLKCYESFKMCEECICVLMIKERI